MSDPTAPASRRPTSRDVARLAGVSRTTVSLVVNDVPDQRISDATRIAVRAAAEELGYAPSAPARALRSGQSRLVLCLAPETDPSALMDEALTLMSRTLRAAGLAVVVAKAPEADSGEVLWSAMSPAVVVAMFDLPTATRARLLAMHVPVVDMYLYSRRPGEVSDDLQVSVGALQAEHLITAGCDRLFAAVPRHIRVDGIRQDRLGGVRRVARQRGLPPPVVVELDRRPAAADPRVVAALGSSPHPGVCAFNDTTALGLMTIARHAGLEAPLDFRVIGVDDEFAGVFSVPSLTTVRLDLQALDRVVTNRVRRALGLAAVEPEPTAPFAQVIRRDSA